MWVYIPWHLKPQILPAPCANSCQCSSHQLYGLSKIETNCWTCYTKHDYLLITDHIIHVRVWIKKFCCVFGVWYLLVTSDLTIIRHFTDATFIVQFTLYLYPAWNHYYYTHFDMYPVVTLIFDSHYHEYSLLSLFHTSGKKYTYLCTIEHFPIKIA